MTLGQEDFILVDCLEKLHGNMLIVMSENTNKHSWDTIGWKIATENRAEDRADWKKMWITLKRTFDIEVRDNHGNITNSRKGVSKYNQDCLDWWPSKAATIKTRGLRLSIRSNVSENWDFRG